MTWSRVGALLSAALVACSVGAGYGSSATAGRWVVTDVARLAALAYPAYRFNSFVGTTSDDRIFWTSYGTRDGRGTTELFEWQNGTISDLGSLPMNPRAINDQGAIAGTDYSPIIGPPPGYTPPPVHAYLWRNGALTNLGTFGGFAIVAGLNDRGQVAETYAPADGSSTRAALWQNGKTTDLGTLGGKFAWANALNDRGQVVGNSPPAAGFGHAFLWDRGKMTDLRAPGDVSDAVDMNERGQVVGWWGRANPGGFRRAFFWQKGKAIDLGPVSSDGNLPITINDHGWVIRSTGRGAGIAPAQGLLWHGGRTIDLGWLGGRQTYPLALDEHGRIVGTVALAGGTYTHPRLRAFLWQNGKMTVFPTSLVYEAPSMSIDETGTHIVLGTCCPEQLLLWTRRPASASAGGGHLPLRPRASSERRALPTPPARVAGGSDRRGLRARLARTRTPAGSSSAHRTAPGAASSWTHPPAQASLRGSGRSRRPGNGLPRSESSAAVRSRA